MINFLKKITALLSLTTLSVAEVPKNIFLSASPWSLAHGQSYNQSSSILPGPDLANSTFSVDTFFYRHAPENAWRNLVNFAPLISPHYSDGKRVYWGSGSGGFLFKIKINQNDLEYVDHIQTSSFSIDRAFDGAYALVDKNNCVFILRKNSIMLFGDDFPIDSSSPIRKINELEIPQTLFKYPDESLVGLNMGYNGKIVIVSSHGLVATVDRSLDQKSLKYTRIGHNEKISNSIATSEDGGIFIVTSEKMYRVQMSLNGSLSQNEKDGAWSTTYDAGPSNIPGRFEPGSGTTPTLVGYGPHHDHLVVIGNGQSKMSVLAFWRDQIPAGWKAIKTGVSPRLAGEIIVDYGNPRIEYSRTENSLNVLDDSILIVNNSFPEKYKLSKEMTIMASLLSNIPGISTPGLQKISWDKKKKIFFVNWSNPVANCPTAVPVITKGNNGIYCMGSHLGNWTLEQFSWEDGNHINRKTFSASPVFNGFWGALGVAGSHQLMIGTLTGIIRFKSGISDE